MSLVLLWVGSSLVEVLSFEQNISKLSGAGVREGPYRHDEQNYIDRQVNGRGREPVLFLIVCNKCLKPHTYKIGETPYGLSYSVP